MNINVIGAGILGASIAYELTLKGHQVTIVDAEKTGRATSAAAGIMSPWISKRRNMAWYALAKGGAAYYATLIDQLHQDGEKQTGYQQVGALKLHDDPVKLKELEQIAYTRKSTSPEMGDIQLLQPGEAKNLFPYMTDKFHALYISGAARVDGDALRNALLRAASKHGASIIYGHANLTYEQHQITGMEVTNTAYPADITIAANGVWMNTLLKPLQPKVRFQAQKGELLHLHISQTDTAHLPVVQPPNNQYILPLDDGRIVAGATHHTAKEPYDTHLSAEGTHYILDQLFKMAPGLAHAHLIDYRTGFRPFTKNHLPVFGPLPEYRGLILANGLGASGLTTAPFIGKQIAASLTGEKTDISLKDYNIQLAE